MNLKSTLGRRGENWFLFHRHTGCCFSEYLHLSGCSLYCSSELQSAAAERKKEKKRCSALVYLRQQSLSNNEHNHSKAKMKIFASELIRQG